MLEEMVQPIKRQNGMPASRKPSVECREISLAVHLGIFFSSHRQYGANDLRQYRTHVDSKQVAHIWRRRLPQHLGKMLPQHSWHIPHINILDTSSVGQFAKGIRECVAIGIEDGHRQESLCQAGTMLAHQRLQS